MNESHNKWRYFITLFMLIKAIARRHPKDVRLPPIAEYLQDSYNSVQPVDVTNDKIIAVEIVEDPLYFALFNTIVGDLRQKYGFAARQIVTRSIDGAVGHDTRARIFRSRLIGWCFSSQWVRLNLAMLGPVGYRSQTLFNSLDDFKDFLQARKVWKAISSSNNIADLTLQGILVGDLIIDTYLRFSPSPKFDTTDKFVFKIIWQTLQDIRKAKRFFNKVRPKIYISTYSTYIEHGIPVRVALSCDVSVFSFGSVLGFGKKLTKNDFFHIPCTDGYRSTFESLSEKNIRLESAAERLKLRVSGTNDLATSYMKTSAYKTTISFDRDISGATVVFLHDFYDSPHVVHDFIFPDFWSWVTVTLDILIANKTKFLVKPHPNQVSLSASVVTELKVLYPQVEFISSAITSAQLAAQGMVRGITVYGTVAHELAYLGIPSIACARHPHHEYSFCSTARSVTQYKKLISEPAKCLSRVELMNMQLEALEFYYMHNIFPGEDSLALGHSFSGLIKELDINGFNPSVFTAKLNTMRHLPAYSALISLLAATNSTLT